VRRGPRATAASVTIGLLAAVAVLPARRPIPFDLCLMHRLTGLPCLTCGLTRSVCLLARGEWRASLVMHPAGWLAFGALVVAAAWLAWEAVADSDLARPLGRRLTRVLLGLGGALSLAVWVMRLAGLWPMA
jgi:uncharacterized protein DUF2752